jgi:pyruvate dehydrogenase E1 component alpha subunit
MPKSNQFPFSAEVSLKLYQKLLELRYGELSLAERYKQQEMRTPTHFGVGQEAVAVGVCHHLKNTDVAYSHHRSHNHYLAKGGSFYRLAAELFGRATGCSGGRGGSVHLTSREHGFIASSAILGQAIAAATGSALALKMDKTSQVATAFFGDAVAEEGAFYESISYAALHKLPVLFVCENNGYATESPLSIRQPSGPSISDRVAAFGVPTLVIDGNDVFAVSVAAEHAISTIRNGSGPYFLEFNTYRWLEHVGPYFDHELQRTYRSKTELESWQQNCPIKHCKAIMLELNFASAEELSELETSIQIRVEADIEKAYQDPWPEVQTLLHNVY